MRLQLRGNLRITTPFGARGLELASVVLVLLVAVSLRLELLTERSLWHDEGFSLAVARKPVWYILKHLPAADPHPPGYYLLLRAVLVSLGEALLPARALSAVLGTLAVLLTWAVARRLLDPPTGVIAAALVAIHPFQVFASNEIRMYPLATCLALLSTWAAWRAQSRGRGADWVAYGVTLAAMAYTSYYTVTIALGQWVALIRHWRRLGLALGIALLLYLPWLPHVPRAVRGIVFVRERFELQHVLELFATQTYGGYLFGPPTYLSGGAFDPVQHAMLVVPFAVLFIAGWVAACQLRRDSAVLFVAVWLSSVGLFSAVSAFLGHLAAYPRHLVFLQPFTAIVLAAGIVGVARVVRATPGVVTSAAVGLAVLSFLGPAVANLQGNPDYQVFRYDRAAALVRNLYRAGDALVFYQGGAQGAFQWYFDPGGVQIAIDPSYERWSREGMRPFFREAVEPIRRVKGRVWLVLVGPYPEESPLDLIETIENLGYRRVRREDFHGVEVVALAKPGKRSEPSRGK